LTDQKHTYFCILESACPRGNREGRARNFKGRVHGFSKALTIHTRVIELTKWVWAAGHKTNVNQELLREREPKVIEKKRCITKASVQALPKWV